MTTRYTFRPLEFEALQFTGGAESAAPILAWADLFDLEAEYRPDSVTHTTKIGALPVPDQPELVRFEDQDGEILYLMASDWLVRSADGEFFHCESPEFDKTFEASTL